MSKRIWTPRLEKLLNDPRNLPILPGEFTNICQNCGGTEMIMVYVIKSGPYGSPHGSGTKWLSMDGKSGWYEGNLESDPCPVCSQDKMQAWITKQCGLAGDDLNIAIGQFEAGGKLKKDYAKRLSLGLLLKGKTISGFVTFHGDFGVGKSMLLKAIVNGFRKDCIFAKYITMADLLAEIRNKFGEQRGVQAAQEVINEYRSFRVLCVDEVDRVNLTDWAKETTFRLLGSRYDDRSELLTVMATNLTPEDLPAEFGYLASRMRGGVVCLVDGPDMRPATGIREREKDTQSWTDYDNEPDTTEYGQYNTGSLINDLARNKGIQ